MIQKLNKKGQLGMDIVKSVILAFMVIAILAVAIILSLSSITDVADDIDKTSVNLLNESTIAVVNDSIATQIPGTTGFRNCVFTPTVIANTSGDTIIPANNFTVVACTITYAGLNDALFFNNTVWNVTGTYKYSTDDTLNIERNVTSGLVTFIASAGTIFSILVVVVIILAISIIIVAVSRFGGVGTSAL